jgi:hypothetical protein
MNGYRAIPMEFIKTVLPSMNCNQWAIWSVLAVSYCWYAPLHEINDFGEIMYNYMITCSCINLWLSDKRGNSHYHPYLGQNIALVEFWNC